MKNRLKRQLRMGQIALGSWLGISDPYAVEMMADAGFDWLLIDMEHFPMTKETLRTILIACKGSESTPVVRVPVNSLDYIQAALDLGAYGVMTPMVNSPEDAKRAVEYCRYPPEGRRGMGPVRAGGYTKNFDAYRREANEEVALFIQIETPEAVAKAEQILATDGIDGVFVGNGDLSSFMNGGQASAAVQNAVDKVIDLAVGRSLPVGLPAWSLEECQRYVDRGATLLTIGSDMGFLVNGARDEISGMRRHLRAVKQQPVKS